MMETYPNFGPQDLVEFDDKVGMVLGFTPHGKAVVTVDGSDYEVDAAKLRPAIKPA